MFREVTISHLVPYISICICKKKKRAGRGKKNERAQCRAVQRVILLSFKFELYLNTKDRGTKGGFVNMCRAWSVVKKLLYSKVIIFETAGGKKAGVQSRNLTRGKECAAT